jgi:hypothetical protein
MNIERAMQIAKDAAPWIGVGIAAYLMKDLAFYEATREEILMRDRGTCQGLGDYGCYWEPAYHKAASLTLGFHVQAAHYPKLHGKHNGNPNAGRVLCTVDHAIEELLRGNANGADFLLQNQTILAYWYMEKEMIEDIEINIDALIQHILAKKITNDYDPRPKGQRLFRAA